MVWRLTLWRCTLTRSPTAQLYFKRVLSAHPDKGGDPAVFRALQGAWEVLRDLYETGRVHASGWSWYFGGAGREETAQAAPEYEVSPLCVATALAR